MAKLVPRLRGDAARGSPTAARRSARDDRVAHGARRAERGGGARRGERAAGWRGRGVAAGGVAGAVVPGRERAVHAWRGGARVGGGRPCVRRGAQWVGARAGEVRGRARRRTGRRASAAHRCSPRARTAGGSTRSTRTPSSRSSAARERFLAEFDRRVVDGARERGRRSSRASWRGSSGAGGRRAGRRRGARPVRGDAPRRRAAARVQTGRVQTYVLAIVLGVIALAFLQYWLR